MRSFFQIQGGNGATFFFSAASFADWRKSLEFYQGVSFIAKVKKFLLTAAYPVLTRKAKVSAAEVVQALRDVLPADAEITLGEHDSAMISPTRDKVIVHHHGRSYEKFACGKSREGVAQELALYQQLQTAPPEHFVCSKLLKASQNDTLVQFEMAYAAPEGRADAVPLTAYAEFFALHREADASWKTTWSRLKLPFVVPEADLAGTTPVGLVHHDFKPWNVKLGKIPLFFDFESASAGLPLEDFFNYTVDPALHFGSARECLCEMRERGVFDAARELLASMGLPAEEVGRYWRWYLCERYDFFTRKGAPELAAKFLELYHLPPSEPPSRWKRFGALAGILLAALVLRLYYAVMHPIQSRDAAGYLLQIQAWFQNGNGEFLNSHPPLYFFLVRALMFCGLSVETAALTVNIAAGTLLIVPVYLAGRVIWKKHSAALAAAAFAAVMPRLIKFSCVALRDGLYLHFMAWSIALWALAICACDKRGKWCPLWSFLCGMTIAASCMCRYETLLFLPFAMAGLFGTALIRRRWRMALCGTLCLCAGVLLGLASLSALPGMPNVIGIYVDRFRVNFWTWKIWGLR